MTKKEANVKGNPNRLWVAYSPHNALWYPLDLYTTARIPIRGHQKRAKAAAESALSTARAPQNLQFSFQ
jgi:hypothetical protein